MCLACLECDAHPRGFVESSIGLMTPGVCLKVVCWSSFQSCIAKNQMSMWHDLPVGLLALIVSMANLSSLHVGVGSCLGVLSSANTDQTCLMFFATVTAAMNLASDELRAVTDHALDWHSVAPPQCVIACPVVDLLLVELFPCAASTNKHTSFASVVSVSVGCLGDSR